MEARGGGATREAGDRPLDVTALRAQLERIRGVRSARIVTDPAVAIRIVSTGVRQDEEIAADVRSLAAAAFGLLVGTKDVTVSAAGPEDVTSAGPPRLAWLNVANEGDSARIDVGVAWQGNETAGGAATRSGSKRSRALAAAQAVAEALHPHLAERNAAVSVSAAESLVVSGREWIVVGADLDEEGTRRPILGSALLESDAVAAGAQALLDAVHRVLA